MKNISVYTQDVCTYCTYLCSFIDDTVADSHTLKVDVDRVGSTSGREGGRRGRGMEREVRRGWKGGRKRAISSRSKHSEQNVSYLG